VGLMDYDLIFRSGKYTGKTVGWVAENDSSYLVWVEECRPEMLKENKKKSFVPKKNTETPKHSNRIEPTVDSVETAIKPNMNFDNERSDFYP
jgi:hypothetical protein